MLKSNGSFQTVNSKVPRISAIICTHDRVEYLQKAILSLTAQTMPVTDYEILIIDNASPPIVCEFIRNKFSGIKNIRYIYEPVLGLSKARNTGWLNARAELVAYLDDDAIAAPQWLEKICETFETISIPLGCVGGKVEPIWEGPRPTWLPDDMLSNLTVLDLSEIPLFLNDDQWLAGANIAFPKYLLKEVNGFREDLGRKGKKLLSMEEIDLFRQLKKKGFASYYHPEILVRHHVAKDRLVKKWFYKRYYWQGVSVAKMRIHNESLSYMPRAGLAILSILKFFLLPSGICSMIFSTNDPFHFKKKCFSFHRVGYVLGLLGIV